VREADVGGEIEAITVRTRIVIVIRILRQVTSRPAVSGFPTIRPELPPMGYEFSQHVDEVKLFERLWADIRHLCRL
jgi:hypothetical protein